MKRFIASLKILVTIFSTLSLTYYLHDIVIEILDERKMVWWYRALKYFVAHDLMIPSFFVALYFMALLFVWTRDINDDKDKNSFQPLKYFILFLFAYFFLMIGIEEYFSSIWHRIFSLWVIFLCLPAIYFVLLLFIWTRNNTIKK